ncbi:hypothetical protein C8R41DRAFT_863795 [Lentinula lateritia]|uniref:Uncharacterized protein n=1 Tax=Lentinula lateritia TaxID=40482 RepID=A0ABQ8VTV9_9AGAR|nr:hypothetical protein C8R41DRAFT_863795 [Lentinula lateritia]
MRRGDVCTEGLRAAHVLHDQSQIPPANSCTDRGTLFHTPGSHSAIAGHQSGPAPNVLMGGNFRAGSFSAVAGDRIVILEEQRPFPQDTYMDYGERRRDHRSSHSPENYSARRRWQCMRGEIASFIYQKADAACSLLERSDSPGLVNIPAYLLVPFYYLRSMDHDNNTEAILDTEGRAASLEVEDEDVSEGNRILIVNRRRDAYTGPSVQGPNNSHPNVLFGAGEFVLTNTKIHAGAFSAVGGWQEIRLRRAQPTQSQHTGNPNEDVMSSVQENCNPTVLSRFDGVIPEAIYGSASFSAVGGIQDIRNKNTGSLRVTKCTQMDVLPNLNGGSFPKPTANCFDDGQHSAIAGNPLTMQDPSVLPQFRHFYGNKLDIQPGAFSAVSQNQTIEYHGD